MVIMYSDDKTWRQHYEEWKEIIANMNGDDKGVLYRKKTIQGLIDAYERDNRGND
jgi:hypothetical protein